MLISNRGSVWGVHEHPSGYPRCSSGISTTKFHQGCIWTNYGLPVIYFTPIMWVVPEDLVTDRQKPGPPKPMAMYELPSSLRHLLRPEDHHLSMGTADVLEKPKQMDLTALTPPSLQPKETKIVVKDQIFEVKGSPATIPVLGKLQRTEDGSYRFPDEWDVRPTQFSVLLDHLHSAK